MPQLLRISPQSKNNPRSDRTGINSSTSLLWRGHVFEVATLQPENFMAEALEPGFRLEEKDICDGGA
jgi:hypothetical protein